MNTTTDYQQQAIDFLQSTGTEFKATFLKHGKHFDVDKENRDIYEIELKRGNRSYKFQFGQSINNSGFYYKKGVMKFPIDRKELNNTSLVKYLVRIDYDFQAKSDNIHYPVIPNAYDVLACLTKCDPGTFENFCGEFGYDTDSRKAEKVYKAVVNEWQNIAMLFTDTEIEQLQEIQ